MYKINKLQEYIISMGFPGGSVVKNPPASAGDMGLIPDRGTKSPLAAKLDHNNNNVAYLVDRLNMNMCNPLLF